MAVGSKPRAAGSAPPGVLPEYPKEPPKRDPSVTHMDEKPPGPERTTVVHSPRRSAIATRAPADSRAVFRSDERQSFPAFSLPSGPRADGVWVQLAYAGSPPPSTGTARIARAAAAAAQPRTRRRFLRVRAGIVRNSSPAWSAASIRSRSAVLRSGPVPAGAAASSDFSSTSVSSSRSITVSFRQQVPAPRRQREDGPAAAAAPGGRG